MTYVYPVLDKVALATKLKAEGGPDIDLNKTSGTLPPEHGVHLAYAVADSKITITVLNKPFFITNNQIKTALDEFFT